MKQFAYANITGDKNNSYLHGTALFYTNNSSGILVEIEVYNLPYDDPQKHSQFYGLHIHEFGNCAPPFDKTGMHFNPYALSHPYHAGDFPPLLGNDGYAFSIFYTNRLDAKDIIGKSIVIHSERDDFTTQPSGNSGSKIGCGVIRMV